MYYTTILSTFIELYLRHTIKGLGALVLVQKSRHSINSMADSRISQDTKLGCFQTVCSIGVWKDESILGNMAPGWGDEDKPTNRPTTLRQSRKPGVYYFSGELDLMGEFEYPTP
jgi:hypothetical protein